MKKLFLICFFLCSGCAISPIHQATVDVNSFLVSLTRKKVETFLVNSKVELFLKHGDPIFGTFRSYHIYDDTIWIRPDGAYGLFSDEAYSLDSLQDIVIVSKLKGNI